MAVETLRIMLPDVQARLCAAEVYWSEIAHRAGLAYSTIEGFARNKPGRTNPRFDTLCNMVAALELIETRETIHGSRA